MSKTQDHELEIKQAVQMALDDSFVNYESVFVSKFFVYITVEGVIFGSELRKLTDKTGFKLETINSLKKGRIQITLEH